MDNNTNRYLKWRATDEQFDCDKVAKEEFVIEMNMQALLEEMEQDSDRNFEEDQAFEEYQESQRVSQDYYSPSLDYDC